MAGRYYTQFNSEDGTYSLVLEDPPGNYRELYRGTRLEAERRYNEITGNVSPTPTPPPVKPAPTPITLPTTAPSPTDTANQDLLPIQQMQHEIDLLNHEYLRKRLELLDIPDMYMRSENDRHKVALDAATSFAQVSGWYLSGSFIENMVFQNNPGLNQDVTPVYPGLPKPGDVGVMPGTGAGSLPPGQVGAMGTPGVSAQGMSMQGQVTAQGEDTRYNTPTGIKTVAQMRSELRAANYPTWEQDNEAAIVAAYARTTNGSVTPVATTAPTAKKWKLADGQVKTIEDIKRELKAANWDQDVDKASEADLIVAYERTTKSKLTLVEGTDTTTPPVDWTKVQPPPTQYPGAPPSAYDPNTWMPTLDREKWWFDKQKYLTDLAANPANLTQTLLMLGMSPGQVSAFLQSTPSVNYLLNQGGWDINLDPGAPSPYWDRASGLPITPGSTTPVYPTPGMTPPSGGSPSGVVPPMNDIVWAGPPAGTVPPMNDIVATPQPTGSPPIPGWTWNPASQSWVAPPENIRAGVTGLGNTLAALSQPSVSNRLDIPVSSNMVYDIGGPPSQSNLPIASNSVSSPIQYDIGGPPSGTGGQTMPTFPPVQYRHGEQPFNWQNWLSQRGNSPWNRWANMPRRDQDYEATIQPVNPQSYAGQMFQQPYQQPGQMTAQGVGIPGNVPTMSPTNPLYGNTYSSTQPYVPPALQNTIRSTPLGNLGTRNPNFPFITGRQLPVRNTLNWLDTSSPMIKLLQDLFSYSGQEPRAAFGEFQSYLPKGNIANPTSYY